MIDTSQYRPGQVYLFAHVACKMPEDKLKTKRLWGLTAALLGVWIAFIFRYTIDLLHRADAINDKLYDLKLITVGDYTAYGNVSQTMWNYFYDNLLFTEE